MSVETQETVCSWISQTFPGGDPESPRKSLRLLEEAVELCLASGATPYDINDAVVKQTYAAWGDGQKPGESRRQPDKIAAEAADVLIVLYGLAGLRGFDLHEEVNRKMVRNRAREWRTMGDGTGYHISKQEAER